MIYPETSAAIRKYILDYYDTTAYRLNKVCGLTTTSLQNLASGKMKITLKVAVILEVAFPDNGMKAVDWLMLDLEKQIQEVKANKALMTKISPLTKRN